MLLNMKPSILVFIICTSLIVVVVILCCFCIIGGGNKKKETTNELPTPSVSIGRSRPLWPLQTYHDVEFGQGFRTYRSQDMTPRSEHSIRPESTPGSRRSERTDRQDTPRSEQSIRPDSTRGSRRSERSDRQDTRESGIKNSGMAILAGAGAAIATAAAVLGLSSDQGGEDTDNVGYVDSFGDGIGGSGVYGSGDGYVNGSQL